MATPTVEACIHHHHRSKGQAVPACVGSDGPGCPSEAAAAAAVSGSLCRGAAREGLLMDCDKDRLVDGCACPAGGWSLQQPCFATSCAKALQTACAARVLGSSKGYLALTQSACRQVSCHQPLDPCASGSITKVQSVLNLGLVQRPVFLASRLCQELQE